MEEAKVHSKKQHAIPCRFLQPVLVAILLAITHSHLSLGSFHYIHYYKVEGETCWSDPEKELR